MGETEDSAAGDVGVGGYRGAGVRAHRAGVQVAGRRTAGDLDEIHRPQPGGNAGQVNQLMAQIFDNHAVFLGPTITRSLCKGPVVYREDAGADPASEEPRIRGGK